MVQARAYEIMKYHRKRNLRKYNLEFSEKLYLGAKVAVFCWYTGRAVLGVCFVLPCYPDPPFVIIWQRVYKITFN